MIGWTGLAANAAVVQRTAAARPAASAASSGRIALGDRISSAAGHQSAKHVAKVKYYIVPRAGHGPSTLSEIAAQTLGNAHLFMTIFTLNRGRVQPNGGRLENPKLIEPGWILELPANASGPGVHFGPLPHPRPRPQPSHSGRASASASPSPASSPTAGSGKSSSAGSLVIVILVLIGALLLAVVGARLLVPRRRGRRSRVGGSGRDSRRTDPELEQGLGRLGWLKGFEDFLSRLDAGKARRPRTTRAGSKERDEADRLPQRSGSARPSEGGRQAAEFPSGPLPAVGYQNRLDDYPSGSMPAVDYRGRSGEYPSGPMPAVDYRRGMADYPSGSMPAVGYDGYSADYPSGPMPAMNYGGRPGEYPSGPMPAVDQWGRPIEYPSGQQEAVGYGNWPPEHPSRPMQAVDYQGRTQDYQSRPQDYQSRPQEPVGYGNWPPEHPSRPMPAVNYQGWPAEHPSRPQEAVDYRGRSPEHQNHPYESPGYPDWPAGYSDYQSRPQETVGYQVWPHPGDPGPGRPGGSGPGAGPQSIPGPSGFAGPSLRESAPVPRHARTQPPLPVPAYGQPPVLRPDDALRYADEWEAEDWPTDALQVVNLLLTGAEGEASKIRTEAHEQATAVRAEASAEAIALRAEASAEAARLRESAEREAESMRASLHAMTTELGEVAAFVTKRLTTPDSLVAEPKVDPAKRRADPAESGIETESRPPGSKPGSGRPGAQAKAGTATEPQVEPKSKPTQAAKPGGGRARQQRAAKMMVIAVIGLMTLGAVSGTVELFLHGGPFFVFRAQGTGATNVGLQENQGPGQPDAPSAHPIKPHHQAKQHQPGKSHPAKPKPKHKPKAKKKHKAKPAKHQTTKQHPAKHN
jgi:hypothetical protein